MDAVGIICLFLHAFLMTMIWARVLLRYIDPIFNLPGSRFFFFHMSILSVSPPNPVLGLVFLFRCFFKQKETINYFPGVVIVERGASGSFALTHWFQDFSQVGHFFEQRSLRRVTNLQRRNFWRFWRLGVDTVCCRPRYFGTWIFLVEEVWGS